MATTTLDYALVHSRRGIFWPAYWTVTALTFVAAVCMVAFYVPNEATMGVIQKIFYFHMPIAISTFLSCLVVFIAGAGYLATRSAWWDDLSAAAASVAVVLCTGVLLTGMLWGRSAWGTWWTWSPRLTFSFVLWLLYVVYLLVRASIESGERRAVVSAVYGVVAFLDVPLVYLSARLLPDIHPGNIALPAPAMKITLMVSFVPVMLIAAGLIATRFKLNRLERARSAERQMAQGFPVMTGGAA